MVVDHLWDLEACSGAESGSATSVFPGGPQGWPAFASGLEEVDPVEIPGPGWVPGLTLTPRLDRESMAPSGSTIMSITGRVSQGRVSVRIKEHLQKAEHTNIITFTCKGNSIIVCWRTQLWKSAPLWCHRGHQHLCQVSENTALKGLLLVHNSVNNNFLLHWNRNRPTKQAVNRGLNALFSGDLQNLLDQNRNYVGLLH